MIYRFGTTAKNRLGKRGNCWERAEIILPPRQRYKRIGILEKQSKGRKEIASSILGLDGRWAALERERVPGWLDDNGQKRRLWPFINLTEMKLALSLCLTGCDGLFGQRRTGDCENENCQGDGSLSLLSSGFHRDGVECRGNQSASH